MTSLTGGSPIHDLNLTVEHTKTDKQEELLNIKGLLGMMKIITELKANLALPPLNQHSEQTTLQFVHSKFKHELTRRFDSFRKNWKTNLVHHCNAYIR